MSNLKQGHIVSWNKFSAIVSGVESLRAVQIGLKPEKSKTSLIGKTSQTRQTTRLTTHARTSDFNFKKVRLGKTRKTTKTTKTSNTSQTSRTSMSSKTRKKSKTIKTSQTNYTSQLGKTVQTGKTSKTTHSRRT